jgi:hypothetical protein
MDSKSLINNFNQVGGMSMVMVGGGAVLLVAGILSLVFACPEGGKNKDGTCSDRGQETLSYILQKWGGIAGIVIALAVLGIGATAK